MTRQYAFQEALGILLVEKQRQPEKVVKWIEKKISDLKRMAKIYIAVTSSNTKYTLKVEVENFGTLINIDKGYFHFFSPQDGMKDVEWTEVPLATILEISEKALIASDINQLKKDIIILKGDYDKFPPLFAKDRELEATCEAYFADKLYTTRCVYASGKVKTAYKIVQALQASFGEMKEFSKLSDELFALRTEIVEDLKGQMETD